MNYRPILVVLFGSFLLLVTGCSESGFSDFMGSGKYSPDETKVRTNQALTMPPDLQLRPPSGSQPADQQQAYSSQPPAYGTQPQTYAGQPPIYNSQQPAQVATNQPPIYQTQPYGVTQQPYQQQPYQQQNAYGSSGQPQTLNQQVAAQQPPAGQQLTSYDQILAKWGVSKYHPDGRLKTKNELNEELRAKKIAQERQKNPGYGTIFNIGSLWNDE